MEGKYRDSVGHGLANLPTPVVNFSLLLGSSTTLLIPSHTIFGYCFCFTVELQQPLLGRGRSGCWFTSSPTSPTPAPWRCPNSIPSPTTGTAGCGGCPDLDRLWPWGPALITLLTPFPHPSFRMRQVNIVGTSPPSQPSRKIQTLQAPPDMAPANVTLRTASETSLWLRWMVRFPRGQWG